MQYAQVTTKELILYCAEFCLTTLISTTSRCQNEAMGAVQLKFVLMCPQMRVRLYCQFKLWLDIRQSGFDNNQIIHMHPEFWPPTTPPNHDNPLRDEIG